MHPNEFRADTQRPFTGNEYLASLNDGRNVFIHGERVEDVTAHPSFRNSARSLARLYDALHDPAHRNVLTTPTDTGSGGYTHRFFKPARSPSDMRAQQAAVAQWARLTYGWMGRSPDFKGALISTWGANADFYGDFAGNARTWHKRCQESVLFLNHAIVNPPVDRSRPAETVRDVYVSVHKETDAGIYVSGAKVVATGAALSQYSFVGQSGATATDGEDLALMFMLPLNAPGCKLLCRQSYEGIAAASGSPFDYPLSSRFDENDAIFVLDNAFVPWEDVFVYRDVDRVKRFYQESGFMQGFCLQACTRYAVKLEFLAGLVAKALRTTGGHIFRGNQVLLGEIVALRNKFWAFSDAMIGNASEWKEGTFLPNMNAAMAYRAFAPDALPRVREIVQKIIASALIYLPSSVRDFDNPEIDIYLKRYVRGSGDIGYRERIKVLKLLWDSTGTEFAGRHELYERNYAGNHEEVRLQSYLTAERTGEMRDMEALVDNCMADYDEQGWVNKVWAPETTDFISGTTP
jgi:4-hydroxyphenylacetate 3-monooxygenase